MSDFGRLGDARKRHVLPLSRDLAPSLHLFGKFLAESHVHCVGKTVVLFIVAGILSVAVECFLFVDAFDEGGVESVALHHGLLKVDLEGVNLFLLGAPEFLALDPLRKGGSQEVVDECGRARGCNVGWAFAVGHGDDHLGDATVGAGDNARWKVAKESAPGSRNGNGFRVRGWVAA